MNFMPHGMCFAWRPDVLLLHAASDASIALAYFSIPALLIWFVRRRPDVPMRAVFWMFSIFIVSCGTTHLLAIWVIWHPAYWLEGAIKAVTAAASVATALMLAPLLPRALALRSPSELERLNAALQRTLTELGDVVRNYEHEHYIASSLQNASLSDVPDRLGPYAISAMYRPGSGDMEIGGDWFDAFALPDGRVVITIGDVAGKGLLASIVMSKVRQALRVAAQIQVDPARILDAADRALEIEYPEAIVTAFVGIIDPAENVMQYGCAGHPRPLLRYADGTLEELAGTGPPLGLRLKGTDQSRTWPVRPDSLLVLFTDGLTESTHDYAVGEQRLRAAVSAPDVVHSPAPARAIFERVLYDGIRDDVAIMVLRFPGESPEATAARWQFDARDATRARVVRLALSERLRAEGAGASDLFALDMVFAELLGNVVRHAPGDVEVWMEQRAGMPILHVLDSGAGFEFLPELPRDIMSERGRGLYIVDSLVHDFHIQPRPGGGSHARVVLRRPANFRLDADGIRPATDPRARAARGAAMHE